MPNNNERSPLHLPPARSGGTGARKAVFHARWLSDTSGSCIYRTERTAVEVLQRGPLKDVGAACGNT
jgi:hypothetical protein